MHGASGRIERTGLPQPMEEELVQQLHAIGKALSIAETLIQRRYLRAEDSVPFCPGSCQR